MDGRYFKGLDAEQKQKLKQRLLSASDEFMYVRELLTEKITALREELESRDLTADENWQVQVASFLAEIRALKHVKKLLTVEDRNSNKE